MHHAMWVIFGETFCKHFLATVVARIRYELLRLATAQLPRETQREAPTLADVYTSDLCLLFRIGPLH
jgi:hypothetical protein